MLFLRPVLIAGHGPDHNRPTISIAPEDLLRSIYVVGKTGTGKSAFLLRLALGAASSGFGLCLIDPHGDLARDFLAHVPGSLWNRIAVFRPAEAGRTVGINILSGRPGVPRALVASALVEVFRTLWGATLFGPRSENLLRNSVLALLETPGTTLLGLLRLLVDQEWRERIVARVTDPVVRTFWTREFPSLGKSFAAEVTAPVLNKLGALSAPAVRRAVGQARPRLDLRDVLDEGKILVADLSGIGRDAAHLLGALLVTGLDVAAHGRAGTPANLRRPLLVVGDEFQNYVTLSFLHLLSEGRKFGLCAALAHQHAAQLPHEIRSAILGNAGTLAAFALGAEDAELIAPEFAPEFDAFDLRRLRRHRMVLRLLIGGEPDYPLICRTFPPPPGGEVPPALLRISAERYGRPTERIDREISEAMGDPAPPSP